MDLSRVRGVGEEYTDLLEESGVDTISELAQRKPETLHQQMIEVNTQKKLVRQLPGLSQVTNWVEQVQNILVCLCQVAAEHSQIGTTLQLLQAINVYSGYNV